jgi:hypothetical protein
MRNHHQNAGAANVSIFAIVAAGVAFSGCATVNSGDYGVALDDTGHPRSAAPKDERLKISAGELSGLASPYFGVVEVTFENNSPAWIEIDHIDLDFGTADKNKSVLIPWGDDIDAWEQATIQRNAIRVANTETALGVLAIGGLVARSAAGNHQVRALGGTVALGALAALDVKAAEAAADATRDPSRFPPTHLLSMPLRIPPGLFAKRWLLLYTAAQPLGGCIDSVILGYETADHEHGRVLVRFRGYAGDWQSSEWQPKSCARPLNSMGPS